MNYLVPDALFYQGSLRRDLAISVRGGLIDSVLPKSELPPANDLCEHLRGQALLPGFVNAHSHAFQRLIRGGTEYRNPNHPSDDFWSWRELMYQSALTLDPDQMEVVAKHLYLEMLSHGITTVGEFHYLHHDKDGRPYADRDELALRLLRAADEVGIEIVMLRVAYHRSGHGHSPNPRQIRFLEKSPEETLESVSRFLKMGRKTGVAPHSLRAVPKSWFAPLREFASLHNLPLHMHVSEQPREIQECLAEHGCRPVELLAQEGLLSSNFTGVHLIHLEPNEIQLLGQAGANVCSCPTTERNLGDGIVAVDKLIEAGCGLTLGSDSQCQIDPLEDARQLEYHLRLKHQQRALLPVETDRTAVEQSIASRLLEIASSGGAQSLGLNSGKIEAGKQADLVAIDLEHPSLLGLGDPLTRIVFGLPREAIRRTYVNGKVVWDGSFERQSQIAREFAAVIRQLETS
jgi:formimidoylglutamate deiminase